MIYVIDISLPALPSGGLRAEGGASGASGEQGQAQQWTIYKRYSDFVKLRKILLANSKSFALSPTGRSARGVSIPDIPPKRWRNFTPEVLLTTAIPAMLFERGEKYIAGFAAWLWRRIGLLELHMRVFTHICMLCLALELGAVSLCASKFQCTDRDTGKKEKMT